MILGRGDFRCCNLHQIAKRSALSGYPSGDGDWQPANLSPYHYGLSHQTGFEVVVLDHLIIFDSVVKPGLVYVSRTGFEPVFSCVRGKRDSRYSNATY